jgi:D-apionate oxidoisomerase
MVMKIALMGAGGKMGCRITDNIRNRPEYDTYYVEISEAGLANLANRGLYATPQDEALAQADVVVLAIPDRLIGRLTRAFIPTLRSGAMVVGIDPAAAYAEVMPIRPDLTYFVTHPCHPPLFNDDIEEAKRKDWFGGVHASQHVLCALHSGPEADYAKGEELAIAMFGNSECPVIRAHRITVEQMAILEPALVETFAAAMVVSIKQLRDEVVNRLGVPAEACDAMLSGHLRIELAVVFGLAGFPFSDGAQFAIKQAQERLFVPDWRERVLSMEAIRTSVREITDSLQEPHLA